MEAGVPKGWVMLWKEVGVKMSEEPSDENTKFNLGNVVEEMIRQRIVHTLRIYPQLSHSMLQVGIGTGLSPTLWHPVLEKMIEEGIVKRKAVKETNPVTKRDQVYQILESTQAQQAALAS